MPMDRDASGALAAAADRVAGTTGKHRSAEPQLGRIQATKILLPANSRASSTTER